MILASLFWQGTPLKTVKHEVSCFYAWHTAAQYLRLCISMFEWYSLCRLWNGKMQVIHEVRWRYMMWTDDEIEIYYIWMCVTLKTQEQHAKELDFKSQPPAGLASGFKWWDSFHSMPGTYANCDATIWEDRWCTTLKCEADFLREHLQ